MKETILRFLSARRPLQQYLTLHGRSGRLEMPHEQAVPARSLPLPGRLCAHQPFRQLGISTTAGQFRRAELHICTVHRAFRWADRVWPGTLQSGQRRGMLMKWMKWAWSPLVRTAQGVTVVRLSLFSPHSQISLLRTHALCPLPFALLPSRPLLLHIAQAQNLKPKTSPDAARGLGRLAGHCRAYEGALTLYRVPPAPGLRRLKINLPSFSPVTPCAGHSLSTDHCTRGPL